MLVSRVVLLASLAPYLAWAQLGGPLENSAVEDCQCSPACEVSEGVAECRRLVPRPDCPCCRVCPQREGDACSESLPCDAEFGLVCSSEGVCKAEYSCAHDAECPEDRFCLGEVCVDPCPILTPCRGSISGGVCVSKDHRPVCECPQGTIANSEGNACIPYNDTVTGCEFEGRLYVEGEVRYDANCQEQCRCGSDGTFSCGPVTCPPGLFLAGQHSHQELCIELRNRPEADQCCVVVACANSLTRPSILTSPVLTHPTPVTQEEFLGDQSLTTLTGRNVGQGLAPVSYEEYQRSLKDLEEELSKKNEKKKTDEKPSEKHKFESSFANATVSTTPGGTATDATAAVSTATDAATGTGTATDAAEETLSIPEVMMESTDVTPEEDTTFRPTEVEDPEQLTVAEVTEAEGFTTLMPLVREEAEQAMQEGQQATEGQAMQEEQQATEGPAMKEEQQATEGPAMKEEQQATEGPAMKEEQQATEGQAMQEEQQATEEDEGQAAVVVEYGDDGEPIHRITVQEHVEVVPETTLAPYDDAATDTTTPALHQEQLSLAREGKMAPGDASSTQEEQVVVEFPKAESKVGAGALKVREVSHNSSTIVLPSTKGGEVYYKAAESSEWQRKIVGAGEDSIILKGLRPSTQYTLKWSGASGGSAKITIDTEEGCRVHNISYATGHEWSEGCQKRCSCRPAGTMDCQPRCLFIAGDITDPLCTERPAPEDPECCVVYDCKSVDTTELSSSATQENLGLPKLLVTEKTHSSITLAWDDFRARTYEGGYVAEYREKQGDSAASTTPEQPWMRKGVPTEERPPRLTVEGLKPNTLYEVRVSIYEDVEEGRLGEATETISVRTEAGCVHGNSSHAVGEFYNGCEERCMCVATGDVRCFERCTLPYFRAGSFKGNPMCSEHPDGSDECCVIVSCASDKRKAFSQCTNVVCGPNAECISGAMASKDLTDIDSDLTLGYCHCLEGFTGDASDLVFGCVSDPSVGHKEGSCTFKNSTYRPGDVFYDECDYRCACNNNTEIECEPRCEFPHEDGSEREPGCEYLPDPEDACCKLRVCNSTSEAATDAARAPSLPSDGCTEGNITYARDEKFYKGCENQCICMGFGDVSCFPRCPPLKVVSEAPKRCETLPDPQDPCCSITVCAEETPETPEVRKANITELKDEMKNMTEAEKEIMMEEVMMNMTEIEKEMTMKEMNMTESEKEKIMKEMNMTDMEEAMRNMTESEKEKIMKEMNMTDMEEAMRNMTATEESEVDEMMAEEEVASTTVMPDGEMLVHFHSPLENMNEGHTHEHTHEDGLTHSHPLEHGVEETHRHNNTDETGQVIGDIHEQSVIEMQSHDIFSGTHNHTHTHDNNMDNSHDQEHDLDNMHTHEHTVEVGVNDWQNQNHDIFNGTHTHTHTHENGITHTHPHHHNMDNSHDHEHSKDDLHTHEDGVTHSHPHEHGKDNTHIHEHAHEDGTTHSHPHEHSIDETHNHEHDVEEVHNHTHMHGDGVLHTHPHDHAMDEDHNHTHSSSMDEVFDHTHTHEDGTTHSHPHGNVDHIHTHDASMDNFHNQTHFNVLEKKNRAEDLGTYDLNILEVMAINATTVVIKVAASDQVLEQVMSSDDQYFVILYSPDSLIWSGRNIPVSDAMIVNFNEIVIYLNDLQPSTPYQFRVRFQDFVSSTSKATLMDGTIQAGIAEVDSSHVGCVAGMQFTEDTECGRQCTCAADGQVICKPRCPHFEVAQFSNTTCTLVPNPDDPCCTIPDCLINLSNENVLEKFEKPTSNPPVDFEHGMDTMNKTKSAHEDENVVVIHKSQDENQESDMFHLVPHVVPDDTVSTSEANTEHDNVTENSHPVRNTLIPGEDAASERPWKPFTSLNDLLSKHNQLGSLPHNPSTVSTPGQTGNSNITENVTKEAFPSLPDNLNHLTASQHNTSSAVDVKNTKVTETVREESTPVLPISIKNAEFLTETEDRDSSYLSNVEIESYFNTSTLLPPYENGTYLPNSNIDENEVSSSLDRNASPHSTLFDEYQLDLSPPDDEIKSNISLVLLSNDSVAEHPRSTNVELSQSSITTMNGSAYLPIQHSSDSAYLPFEDREGSYLPDENIENVSHTQENVYSPDENEEDSHIPKDDDNFHLPSEHNVHSHPTNIENSHLHKENKIHTNQSKVQRPNSFVPSATEDPVHHINEEAPDIVGGDSFTTLYNKTDIHGRSKDGVDGVDVDTSMKCSLNGRYYKPGQEFYEGCSHSCICTETLEVHCAAIECPVTFGLELIDPNCLEWDLDPDYIPKPPKCCAQVKCISSSACQYMGQTFDNYEQIPRELTGCSQVCTCNYGNVTCRDLCDPVPNIPPPELKCDPQDAVLITLPGETCCRSWQCAANSVAEFEFLGTTEVVETTQFPGDSQGTLAFFPLPPVSVLSGNPTSGFVPVSPPAPPNFGADSIAEPRVMSVDARTAHFFFSTPALYQGLPGELFIRFTDDPVNHPDPSTWSKEVLVPMGSMISQSEWDHILSGLQPSTEYTVQLVLTVQGTEPVTSPVFTYTTMGEATTPSTTTPLPHLDINADLYASEITKTTAKVSWRVFKDMELQYIDGVLVKYTEEDKRIPKFSSMLHRDNNQVDLRDLQPGRSYTVDLDFIPHKNQTTQVSNTKNITFTTLPEEDPYAFEIEITAGKVSSQTAELFYSGIPEPEEKYVNVYRVVYLREVERIDAQTFKIPKTGQERKVFLNDLKPDIEYQVWLEAYLSNGRKKKSNVLTITTRAGELPKPERSEVDPSAKESEDGESYYPALVAVAIIAAIACLGFLGLLVILLRKQSHAKAHINSSRNNTRNNAAYDNPSYKVGDNTYDMEMNGIKGSGNGATHAEEP